LNNLLKRKALQINKIAVETTNLIGLDLRLRYEHAVTNGIYPKEEKWETQRVKHFLHGATSQKGGRAQLSKEMKDLIKDHYLPLRQEIGLELEKRDGIPSNALSELATAIATSINTNVKMHFFSRQLKYIQLKYGLSKKDARKKQDVINEEAKEKQGLKEECLPSTISKSVAYDLEVYPEKFLFPMWKMNCFLCSANEKLEKKVKLFAVLPLSKGIFLSIH